MPTGTRWWLALRMLALGVALAALVMLLLPRQLHHAARTEPSPAP
jgi:hypothetical protein